MTKEVKLFVYGALTWLVPFVVAYLVRISEPLMLVIYTLTLCTALVLYFQSAKISFNESVKVGLIWFAINIVLDLVVVLFDGGGISLNSVLDLAVRYLCIPIIAIAFGMKK